MLGNMTLRMQEKYRGVDNVGKKKRRGCETHRKKEYRNKNWMRTVAWLPN